MICKNCRTEHSEKVKCPICENPAKPPSVFEKISKLDEILAVICLSLMVITALIQIFLRNFFQTGVEGAEFFVRHLVLWIVLLGAGIAAKDNSHIKIDIVQKFLPEKINRIVKFFVTVFSSCILGILIYSGIVFVESEFQYSSISDTPIPVIPVWALEVIIPIGYTIVAIHIIICGIKSLSGLKDD